MPIYIPPLVKKVATGTIPTGLNDLSDVIVSAPTSGDGLVYNGSLWVNVNIATQAELNNFSTLVTGATGSLQTQINGNDSDIANLQQQINEITTGIKIVFNEEFTGNGVATTATLSGAIENGSFISGGWAAIEVANTLPAYVTDLNGKPIYNSSNIFTRSRISVTSISPAGLVTLSHAPLNGQQYKVWYFYSLSSDDRLADYYRDDFVAGMEEEISSTVLATQVQLNTAAFNGILNGSHTTAQSAFDAIDDHVHSQYTLLTTTASISSDLQFQIDNISAGTTSISSSGGSILVTQNGSAFNLEVASAPVSNHNDLLGLQGGISGEYYHLTASEYANISGAGSVNTSVQLPWKYDISTTASDPGSGKFRLNNTTVASATALYISKVSNNGIDTYNILNAMATGDRIYLQNSSDANEAIIVTISGAITNNTTWFSVPFTVDGQASSTTFSDKKIFSFLLIKNSSVDLSAYTPLSTTASISGDLQNQINSITIPTSATFLSDYDARYVNVSGDTMTGNLTFVGGFIQLDTALANPAYQEGRLFYDNEEKALSYYTDINGITVNVGQEHLIKVRNVNGSPLVDGDVVYVFSANGNNVTVKKARADLAATSRATIGVVTQACADNADTYITRLGKVHGLNTQAYNEGDTVYLSATTAGGWTTSIPSTPHRVVRIGYVTKKSAGDGHILVDINDGLSLTEINDVWITSATNGQVIAYNASNSRWENLSVVAATSGALDSRYTLLSTTASISGDLQTQINTKQNEVTLVAGNNISITESPTDTWTISANISGSSSLLQGIVTCDTTNLTYSVSHTPIDLNFSFPTVSLIVPTSGSNLFVQGITNRSASSFDVTLSEVPNITGYYISWHLPTTNSSLDSIPVINLAISNIPSYTTTVSGSYNVSLYESVVYADNANTIVLPASPSTDESHWIVNTYTADITIDGNGKDITVDGINYPTLDIPPDSSIHLHFNATKNKWYVI